MSGGFLSIDGKYYKFGSFLADVIFIGFIWLIFSLPIVTIGATTTALYYVCTKKRTGHDVYIFLNFWKSFKENFVKSTIIFLILAALGLFIWVNINLLGQLELGALTWPITIALYFVLFQITVVVTNVFCILSRFDMSIIATMRSAFVLGNRHLFATISNWVTLAAIIFVLALFPILLLLVGGVYIYFSSFIFVRLFRKNSEEFEKQV